MNVKTQVSLVQTVQVRTKIYNGSSKTIYMKLYITNQYVLVCDISCKRGYSPNKEICKCELIDICEAENPCQNGGTCVLHVIPEQYRCECQNEFGNTNCTGIDKNIASPIFC